MPRIRCHYLDCVFLDEGYCSAAAVEVDPDTGCATYSPTEAKGDDWEEEEEEVDEWEDDAEEEDELWEDEEDEF